MNGYGYTVADIIIPDIFAIKPNPKSANTMEPNETKKTLAVRQKAALDAVPLDQLQVMAKAIAASGMFGATNESQALALFMICQAEGLHPVMALRRYHIIEGRPAMRADAMQAEFEQLGTIIWHERTDTECAATFFLKRNLTKEDIERARNRYRLIQEGMATASLAMPNEVTIVRTIADAMEKRVAMSWSKDANNGQGGKGAWVLKKNWKQSPRQMLHWRCLTEGVRAVAPGIVAGVYTEDEIIDDQREPNGNGGNGGEAMTAEEKVNIAAANATGDEPPTAVEVEIVEPEPEAKQPVEITDFNWRDLVCHVGKAKGEMFQHTVGPMHPSLISYLHRKWVPSLKDPINAKDAALAKAVGFAVEQPKTALWMKFEDEWQREEFFEALKAESELFTDKETKFGEITEEQAEKILKAFTGAQKIVEAYQAKKKPSAKPNGKGS